MKDQVVGFLFDPEFKYVALVRKNHPGWMAGLLNGIGGKPESQDGGIPEMTMAREFREETGEAITYEWHRFATLSGSQVAHQPCPEFTCHFFYANGPVQHLRGVLNDRGEEILVLPLIVLTMQMYEAKENDYRMIPNLSWLIPLAISCGRGRESARRFGIQEYYASPFPGQTW